MSYVAHAKSPKRPRVESYDNNGNGTAGDVNHSDEVLLHIRQLFLNREFADIEFQIGSDVIPAHKAVISVSSKLRQLITGQTQVKLEDTLLKAFKELLRYLYTGRMAIEDFEPQMISEVKELAERYEMWKLVEVLQDKEELDINLDNVIGLSGQSPIGSMTAKTCLSFIAHNIRDVLCLDDFYELDSPHFEAVLKRNDLNVSEELVFEAAKRYVSGTDVSAPDKRSVMSAVRLELLPYEYLWTTVRTFAEETKLISIEELSAISVAKSKLSKLTWEIRDRAICLPNATDVIALNTKNGLSTRVLKGKLADVGEEADKLELDLGVHYLLTGLGIIFTTATKDRISFKVETSVDNSDWQTLYDFTKYHTSNKLDLAFDPKVIRYLRITNAIQYPDWADKRKESKPIRKVYNIVAVYEEPSGLVRIRDNLLASKYLFQHMNCDFLYKSWFKKNGKNFYVCPLNDPIVCILSQPVWMDTIHLFFPDDEEKEYNFTVEVATDPDALVSYVPKASARDKSKDKGWLMVGNYERESRSGSVDIVFDQTVVIAFRVTGKSIVNGKGKDFAVEIRI